jgi:hypothetical protein
MILKEANVTPKPYIQFLGVLPKLNAILSKPSRLYHSFNSPKNIIPNSAEVSVAINANEMGITCA